MEMLRVPPEHDADRDFELGVPGFRYPDLHKPERLRLLHDRFLFELEAADPALAKEFAAYRAAPPAGLAPPAESELLIRVARHVARFVARLFRIEATHGAQLAVAVGEAVIFRFKKDFVKWRCAKRKDALLDENAFAAREAEMVARGYDLSDELAFAQRVMSAVDREAKLRASGSAASERRNAAAGSAEAASACDEKARATLVEELEVVDAYISQRLARHDRRGWVSLRMPEPISYDALVEIRRPDP